MYIVMLVVELIRFDNWSVFLCPQSHHHMSGRPDFPFALETLRPLPMQCVAALGLPCFASCTRAAQDALVASGTDGFVAAFSAENCDSVAE
jgi:hypothetical protein